MPLPSPGAIKPGSALVPAKPAIAILLAGATNRYPAERKNHHDEMARVIVIDAPEEI